MFKTILITILVNGLSLLATDKLSSQFTLEGGYLTLVYASLILGILNGILKPALKLVAFPLKYLTLGISTIVINIFIFIIADVSMEALFGLTHDLIVQKELASYVIIGMIFGTVNWISNLILK